MTVTQQPSTSTTELEEGIVGVDGTSNQAVNRVIQLFFATSPGEDLGPGLVLQDMYRTIACWLNVAGDLVTAKKGKIVFLATKKYVEPRDLCVIPQSIFIYTHYFVAVIIH